MRSRYDLMPDSGVVSPKGTDYKDIFSLPMQKFIYNENSVEATLSKPDINRPDYLGSKVYGKEELEDILLYLNGMGLLQYSVAGDTIEIPSKTDLENFYYKYRL